MTSFSLKSVLNRRLSYPEHSLLFIVTVFLFQIWEESVLRWEPSFSNSVLFCSHCIELTTQKCHNYTCSFKSIVLSHSTIKVISIPLNLKFSFLAFIGLLLECHLNIYHLLVTSTEIFSWYELLSKRQKDYRWYEIMKKKTVFCSPILTKVWLLPLSRPRSAFSFRDEFLQIRALSHVKWNCNTITRNLRHSPYH